MAMTLATVSLKDSSTWYTLLNLIYPIGSLYFSYESKSPATRFGGTWSKITGRFIYANAGTSIGGKNSYDLEPEQIPAHRHAIKGYYDGFTGGVGSGDAFYYASHAYNSTRTLTGWAFGGRTVTGSGTSVDYVQPDSADQNPVDNMPAYQTVYCWRRTA